MISREDPNRGHTVIVIVIVIVGVFAAVIVAALGNRNDTVSVFHAVDAKQAPDSTAVHLVRQLCFERLRASDQATPKAFSSSNA